MSAGDCRLTADSFNSHVCLWLSSHCQTASTFLSVCGCRLTVRRLSSHCRQFQQSCLSVVVVSLSDCFNSPVCLWLSSQCQTASTVLSVCDCRLTVRQLQQSYLTVIVSRETVSTVQSVCDCRLTVDSFTSHVCQ